jgi:hypothetical protein
VLLRSQTEQLGTQERTRLKVERLTSVAVGELARACLTLGRWHRTEINDRHRDRTRRLDHLHGLVTPQDKARAQRLMTRHHLIEATL